jgi:predicted Zn-dependent protease
VPIAVAAVVMSGTIAIALRAFREERPPEGVSVSDYQEADRKFEELYRKRGGRLDVLSLAAEMAVADGRLTTAVACFREIPSGAPRYGLAARLQEGQVLLRLNRAIQAEQSLRTLLERAARDPAVSRENVVAARKSLAFLLSVELRLEERKSILADLHADGQADLADSKQLYFPNLLLWHSSTGRHRLSEFLAEDPDNRLLRVAEARYLTAEGRLDESQDRLEALLRQHPHDRASTAALLECLYERNDWAAFSAVAGGLPDYERGEPWVLTRMRGELALHNGDWESAATAFEWVVAADPANPWSNMGLARAFAGLARFEDRAAAQHRSAVIARIRVSLANVQESNYEAAEQLAAECAQIGFREAAETFSSHAARMKNSAGQAKPGALDRIGIERKMDSQE